jgi:3D (Asp-Asp-Asp) domain-containing protein
MSCYYTTLQSDWGTVPNHCKSVTIKGVVYSGTITNPYSLSGTYCSSFIAEVKLQGSGVLAGGQDIQYDPSTNKITKVSQINGADGTPVVANKTVARSRSIIPTGGVHVDIDQIGTNLLANDTGGDIVGYRIDLYRGAGSAVCTNYKNIISVSACNPGNSKCPARALR